MSRSFRRLLSKKAIRGVLAISLKTKTPKTFYAIVPHKAVLAIISTLIALMAIHLGASSVEVGVIIALMTIGNLLGSLIWAKVVAQTRKYVTFYLFGNLGLFIGCLLLLDETMEGVYAAALTIPLLSASTYFSALFLVNEEFSDRLSEMVGRFESIGGWAWVGGLVFGVIAAKALSPFDFSAVLTIASFLAIFYASSLLGGKILHRAIEGLKKDFGLLPLLDSALEKVVGFEEVAIEEVLTGFHEVLTGDVVQYSQYFKIAIPREYLAFYLSQVVAFVSFGLVYPQLVPIMKMKGFEDSIVYLISLTSSIIAALTYTRVGKTQDPRRALFTSYATRALLFFALVASIWLSAEAALALLLFFSLLDGYTWAYIVILLNLSAMNISKEAVGVSNFMRNLGYVAGSVAGGIVATAFGYAVSLPLAAAVLALGVALTMSARGVFKA